MKKRVDLKVANDHVEKIIGKFGPKGALAEMIWNALDADATEVKIEISKHLLGGIKDVVIRDNGRGMDHAVIEDAFENLGGSWKKGQLNQAGRPYHGQLGEGRFSAFAIGNRVTWWTCTQSADGKKIEYTATIDRASVLGTTFVEPKKSARETGTIVTISNARENVSEKALLDAVPKLALEFALYLERHPSTRIAINERPVDPKTLQEHTQTYPLPSFTASDGKEYNAGLTIIEWSHGFDRELALCGPGGHTFTTILPRIHAPGFDFTAYLHSDLIAKKQAENLLAVAEMDQDLSRLIDVAKKQMREHFERRRLEKTRSVVERWKAEKVYPYEGEPTGDLEKVERQLFDVVAIEVANNLPKFEESDLKTRQFSFKMLQIALEQNPGALNRIFREVFELPPEKVEEMSQLLTKTTLTSMINATKLVVDRLEYLKGLRSAVFDYKKQLKERKELHRMLAPNAWLFGEEFHVATDDEGLDKVLAKHLALLGEREDPNADPVRLEDGSVGIPDLMLSKTIPTHGEDSTVHHLVIELKRPSKKIDGGVLGQLKGYALTVADDDRFKNPRAKWTFWALSNELTREANAEVNQDARPQGLAFQGNGITIWAKTWAQVFAAAEARLLFFKEALSIVTTEREGIDHLKKVHEKHMGSVIQVDAEQAENDEGAPDRAQTTPAPKKSGKGKKVAAKSGKGKKAPGDADEQAS